MDPSRLGTDQTLQLRGSLTVFINAGWIACREIGSRVYAVKNACLFRDLSVLLHVQEQSSTCPVMIHRDQLKSASISCQSTPQCFHSSSLFPNQSPNTIQVHTRTPCCMIEDSKPLRYLLEPKFPLGRIALDSLRHPWGWRLGSSHAVGGRCSRSVILDLDAGWSSPFV